MKLTYNVQVLNKDEMDKIHSGALRVMKNVGARVQSERLCRLLAEYGCEVQGEIVKFPGKIVEKVVEKMRASQANITDSSILFKELKKEKDQIIFCIASGQAITVHDFRTGALRDATRRDLRDSIQILNALPGAGMSHPPFIPQDVPPMVRDIYAQAIVAEYYPGKNSVDVFSAASIKYLIEIGVVLSGSEEAVRKAPPFIYELPFTAFQISAEDIKIMFELYDRGIKCGIGMVMPLLGASTPVTLAGELVAQTAEVLCANVISDALFGEVQNYHAGPTLLDMTSTSHSQSAPETSLLFLATMELARYYGNPRPVFNYALSSDSKITDVQAGLEKGYKCMLAALAGSPALGAGLGVLSCANVSSLTQMVIDYELCMLINRLLRGIEVNDDTLAVDLIIEKGIKGFYLDELHTMEHFKNELFLTSLFNRDNTGKFIELKDDMVERAKKKVEALLAEEPKSLLTKEQKSEIGKILAKATKELS